MAERFVVVWVFSGPPDVLLGYRRMPSATAIAQSVDHASMAEFLQAFSEVAQLERLRKADFA